MSENTKLKKEKKAREKALRKQVLSDPESVKLVEALVKSKREHFEFLNSAGLAHQNVVYLRDKRMKKHDIGWFDVEILEKKIKETLSEVTEEKELEFAKQEVEK